MITIFYIRSRQNNNTVVEKFLEPPPSPPNPFFKLFMCLILFSCLVMATKPFIEYDDKGNPRLATWRQEKLDKEVKDLEYAEQYALRAGTNGWYPCYSCIDRSHLYLYKGQIWKYGITTKGQKGRYGNGLTKLSLDYEIQYEGTLSECLIQERQKIYAYALLPENLARKKPLIRPPGNKKDS